MSDVRKRRLADGHYIGNGACNPGAILNTMKRWTDEDSSLRFDVLTNDPAFRQALYQLYFLTFGGEYKNFDEDYNACIAAVELLNKEKLHG